MSVLRRLAINDEGFVFDPSTGESFILNSTGQVLMRALQQGRSEPELVGMLTDRFAVETEQASADVEDFLGQLRTLNIE